MRQLLLASGNRLCLAKIQMLSCCTAMVIGLFAGTSSGQILELNPASEELPRPSAAQTFFEREGLVEPAKVAADETLTAKPLTAEPVVAGPVVEEPLIPEPPVLPQPEKQTAADSAAADRAAAETQTMPVRELRGEPIARGPIHEAFAEPLRLTPEAAEVLAKAPPPTVEEIPPTATDATKKMQWISGYWAWDKQRKDYVWVSGVWRKAPKNRVWIAGRWEDVEDGHQWVPGAWLKSNEDGELVEVDVLPKAPPKSLEEGPTSPAPSDNHFWVPGVWKHKEQNQTRTYAWRPGFWTQSQSNWVWVPDHYTWTPVGCTYVAGYWDYTWERRGTLYAPCTFAGQDLSGRVCYTPTKVVDTNQWLVNLWVGPSRSHYYYGDYYDYAGLGYSPWYSYYGSNRGYYDPFYTYYRQRFPSTYGIGLYGYLDGLHSYYRSNVSRRPSVSFYGHNHRYGSNRLGYSSMYGNVSDLYRHLGRGSFDSRYGDRYRAGYGYGFDRTPNRSSSRATYVPQRAYSTRPYPSGSNRDGYGSRNSGSNRSRTSGSNRSRSNSQLDRDVRDIVRTQRQPKPRTTPATTPAKPPRSQKVIGGNTGRGPFSAPSRGPFTQIDRTPEADRNRFSNPKPKSNSRTSSPHRQGQKAAATPSRTITSQSRPQTRPQTRPQSRPQTRPQSRPTQTVTRPSRPQSRPTQSSRPVTRPNPKPTRRSTPQVSRPAPKVNRVTPKVTRQAPSRPSSRSSGFSTSGMKKARGADLQRQRAAMQKAMQKRKGR